MNMSRAGCYYCFKTLDPQDHDLGLQSFCACAHCGQLYHKRCWDIGERCLKCGVEQSRAVSVAPPPVVHPRTMMRAVPIVPSSVINVTQTHGRRTISWVPNILQLLQSIGTFIRSLILATLLIGVASAIGIYAYRVSRLTSITPITVMDAVFKSDLPLSITTTGTFVAAAITALVFFPKRLKNTASVTRLTEIFGGVAAVILMDSLLFLPYLRFQNLQPDINPQIRETLFAQGITALIVVMLASLHQSIAPLTRSGFTLPMRPWLAKLLLWTRFLIVVLIINVFSAFVATTIAANRLNTVRITRMPFELKQLTLQSPIVGAFLVGMGISAILYRPPMFRNLQGFATMRLLIFIACVIVVGFLYRSAPLSESYLIGVIIVSIFIFIGLPLQRSLS